ncbi:hypothetical protein [Martelella sp. HB161492]|uniref:hypothetical protein n=1 Tax=Martelella sp. HB161492 TaxID=2720726 RepID=UPI001591BB84|nr:hypothetical protein [Martelella sp. HB161492]
MGTPEYPSKIAKTSSVIAMLGSAVWMQWPFNLNDLSIGAVLAFIASFGAWISIEIADYQNSSNSTSVDEDIRKFNHLLEMVNRNQYVVLKEFAVETYIDSNQYEGLEKISRYHEVDIFKFHNEAVQLKYDEFCNFAQVFLGELWLLYKSDGRGQATWLPRRNDGWVDEERFNKIMVKVYALTQKTTGLSDLWAELVSLARKELKGGSLHMEQYEL